MRISRSLCVLVEFYLGGMEHCHIRWLSIRFRYATTLSCVTRGKEDLLLQQKSG